jgi:hypothetical protein
LEGGAAGFGEWLLETRENLLLAARVPTMRKSTGHVNAGENGAGDSEGVGKEEKETYENEVHDDKGKLQQ